MRLAKRTRKTRMEMDMTPMIDVAFQLIIFFMTVSQMTQANNEPLDLPKQPGQENQKPHTLIVNVSQAGDLRISGESTSIAGLVTRVSRELEKVGDNPDRILVNIRAHELSDSRGVNEVVTALAKLRITRVHIAVDAGG